MLVLCVLRFFGIIPGQGWEERVWDGWENESDMCLHLGTHGHWSCLLMLSITLLLWCSLSCAAMLSCCQWSSLLSRSEVSIPPTSGKSQHKPTSVSSLRSPFSLFIDWTISVFFDQSLNHDDAWNVICWQSNEVFITIGLDSERETHHNGHYPVLVLHDAGHCCSHSADICS